MNRLSGPWRFRRVIGVVALGLFLSYLVYDYGVNEPIARAARQELEREIEQIAAFPDARLLEQVSSNKSQSAFVSHVYFSKTEFEDIRKHYEKEFSRLGWEFARETVRNKPGNNSGNIILSFCKGTFTASLRYRTPVNATAARWTYAIDLSWWIRGCDPI